MEKTIQLNNGSKVIGTGYFVLDDSGSTVRAYFGSIVYAYPGSTVDAEDGSIVVAYTYSTVYAESGSKVFAYSGSDVIAHYGSRIREINEVEVGTRPSASHRRTEDTF